MNLRLWIADCGFGERTCRVGVRRVRKVKLAATGRGIAPLPNVLLRESRYGGQAGADGAARHPYQRYQAVRGGVRRREGRFGGRASSVGRDFRFCSGNGRGWENGEKIPSKFPPKVRTETSVLLGKWKGVGISRFFPLQTPSSAELGKHQRPSSKENGRTGFGRLARTRLEAAFTGRQDVCRYEVRAVWTGCVFPVIKSYKAILKKR